MSSTRRGEKFGDPDYYSTPPKPIDRFLRAMLALEPTFLDGTILDPCAGGHIGAPMAYPERLIAHGVEAERLETIDIRVDSHAAIKADYLGWKPPAGMEFSLIISNPPFTFALPIIQRALTMTREGGFVAMLLRLNFLGSQDRYPFWRETGASYVFVHAERIAFNNAKGTDSIEYAHFVWRRGSYPESAELRVIR